MAFPHIRHCIVCEDIRIERGNKATILGYYGITPDVRIGILEFEKPLNRLMFMFIGAEGEGKFKTGIRILNPQGKEQKQLPALELDLAVGHEKNSNIAIGLQNYQFHDLGRHRIQLIVDDEIKYETTVDIYKGSPADLN